VAISTAPCGPAAPNTLAQHAVQHTRPKAGLDGVLGLNGIDRCIRRSLTTANKDAADAVPASSAIARRPRRRQREADRVDGALHRRSKRALSAASYLPVEIGGSVLR
jgi:hypothetical protein